MNDGLDCLGTHERVGFDFLSLLKGAAAMAAGSGDKDKEKDKAAAEAHRLEEERAAKASRTKLILIAVGSLVGVGGLALLLRRRG